MGSDERRHADTTDRTAISFRAGVQGAAIRAAWSACRHLAASRGQRAACVLASLRAQRTRDVAGVLWVAGGEVASIRSPRASADTDSLLPSCARVNEMRRRRKMTWSENQPPSCKTTAGQGAACLGEARGEDGSTVAGVAGGRPSSRCFTASEEATPMSHAEGVTLTRRPVSPKCNARRRKAGSWTARRAEGRICCCWKEPVGSLLKIEEVAPSATPRKPLRG